MLTLTSEMQTELAKDDIKSALLVSLPGSLLLTDWHKDLTWDGNTYLANGLLLEGTEVTFTEDMTASPYSIMIGNANTTALALYGGGTNYGGAKGSIYLALLDANGDVIEDVSNDGPILVYRGLFDNYGVTESGGKSVIKLQLKSHWASFKRKAGRFTNSASQEEVHPGDTFFQYGHLDQVEMKWGAE